MRDKRNEAAQSILYILTQQKIPINKGHYIYPTENYSKYLFR